MGLSAPHPGLQLGDKQRGHVISQRADAGALPKGDASHPPSPLGQHQLQMGAFRPHGPCIHHRGLRPEQRRRVTEACGLQRFQRRDEQRRDLVEVQIRVVLLHWDVGCRVDVFQKPGIHRRPEVLQSLGPKGQPRRLLMAAEAHQRVGAAHQRRVDVDALDAAAGAGQHVAPARQQYHGIVVLFHQPGSRQPDHAGIPVVPRQDQGPMGGEVEALQLGLRLREDAGLHRLAAGVLRLQRCRLRLRPGGVRLHHQRQ